MADVIPLAKLLEQSEHVKDLVQESATELLAANVAFARELAMHAPLPGLESILRAHVLVARKAQIACNKVAAVNWALEDEVRNRTLLDLQFAAAREQEEAARHAAFHDVLTGLPNRALFNDRLEHGLAHARRRNGTLAVMFVDLDKFKNINDAHGHGAGDLVLRSIAQRLAENIRGEDTSSRLGGDEFLLLLTNTGQSNVAVIAEKILQAIQAPIDITADGLDVAVSVDASIGIAVFPYNGDSVDALVRSADDAMYQAKLGGSRYSFAQ